MLVDSLRVLHYPVQDTQILCRPSINWKLTMFTTRWRRYSSQDNPIWPEERFTRFTRFTKISIWYVCVYICVLSFSELTAKNPFHLCIHSFVHTWWRLLNKVGYRNNFSSIYIALDLNEYLNHQTINMNVITNGLFHHTMNLNKSIFVCPPETFG